MKVSDFYDSTHYFFRDLFGYWFPGIILIIVSLFRFLNIADQGNQVILNLFERVNIYSFVSFILIGSLGGYVTSLIAHLALKPFVSWKLKRNNNFQNLLDLCKECTRRFLNTLHKDGTVSYALKDDERFIATFGKHILYLRAQVEYPEYYKSLVPRYNALRLFHENLTIVFAYANALYFSYGIIWFLFFLTLRISKFFFAIYVSLKWEMRRQCLVIISLMKQHSYFMQRES